MDAYNADVSDEVPREVIMKSKEDTLVENMNLNAGGMTNDIDVDYLQEAYISEFDEFVHVQMKKKDWVTKRNDDFRETRIMKEDSDEEDRVQVPREKGEKDNYWGEGEGEDEDNSLLLPEEEQYKDRDSDDEGAFSAGDDDEDIHVLDKHEWLLYEPTTPFGRVQLELGQLFEKVEVLKRALIYYSCQTHRSFRYCHNEPKRVFVKCKFYPECPWKLSTRYMRDYECIQIRFFKDIHTCTPTRINKRVNADFLAEEYQEKLLKHPTWKLKSFVNDVKETYGVKINRWQAGRTKKNALSACGKVVERQYDSLTAYMYEMKRSNVGANVFLSLKSCIPQFHMIYINFAAVRHNFLHGCRRVLGLDSAFLKGYCKGEILCAVARDANNQMFPVAWAVVEIESKESLAWFLGHLIQDLEMGNGNGWTLLSDQQKAVEAYTEKELNDVMQQLRQQSERAYTEMCARDVTKFCRCFYKTWACTDVNCNKMAESFNSWILDARDKPILSMLEEIRRQVMSRMVEKIGEAAKCNRVTPRIRAKLNEFRQVTRKWVTIEASTNVYEVQHTHNSTLSYTVRLYQKVCACKYWDLNGVPCEHATSATCVINQDPESYVAFWYTKESYEASYSVSI
ncbi:uncharacterized protein LOC141644782 [Silene latifolia]|uniref:uncharacterized protein LOC141644782 n=1 Tax=Silene latifolia TaxID=37657 RepID=UPI003D7785EF